MQTDEIIQITNATTTSCSGVMAIYGLIEKIDPATAMGCIGLFLSIVINFYFNLKKKQREDKKEQKESEIQNLELEIKKIEIERKLNIELEMKNREFELLKKQNEELKKYLINNEFLKLEDKND